MQTMTVMMAYPKDSYRYEFKHDAVTSTVPGDLWEIECEVTHAGALVVFNTLNGERRSTRAVYAPGTWERVG